jgi:hypothetical protein
MTPYERKLILPQLDIQSQGNHVPVLIGGGSVYDDEYYGQYE